MEEPWKQYRDSSCPIHQLGLKINSGFPMTKSGDTPWAGMPACLLIHHAREVRMPPRSNYSLSGLSSWLHQDFRHSRKIHICSTLAQNVTILYFTTLRSKSFSLCLISLWPRFWILLFFNWSDCWLIPMVCPAFYFNSSLEFVSRIFFSIPCKLVLEEV